MKIIIISLVAVFTFSGCSGPVETITIESVKTNKLQQQCRLDHYSCNEDQFFATGMDMVKKMLDRYSYLAQLPELAPVGVACDINLNKKVSSLANNKPTWFMQIELEFYDLASNATLRKTVLKGQAATDDDIIPLAADMVRSYLDKFADNPPVEIPLAKGRSSYDKQGRSELLAGELNLALTSFRNAVDARPDDHAAWYNLGLTYEKFGQLDQALSCYRKAFELKPADIYRQAVARAAVIH